MMTGIDATPHPPFTQPWADAFRATINHDAAYRSAATGWKWPLALVLDGAQTYDYPATVGVRLDLEEGECREARVIEGSDFDAPFVLRGPYAVWKRIVTGELDPLAAVVKQELALEGRLHTLIMHTKFAKALVACAQAVPTTYPDEG